MQTDEESEIFDIQKGSKQGDPLSSLLFNTVLQYALKSVIQKWQRKKGMGIYLSDQERDCLTNLRFADDVMLFATSQGQIQNMMCEFKEATEKVGLTIHPNKTKILSNESSMNSDTKRYIKIGDMDIEILAKSESVRGVSWSEVATVPKRKSRRSLDLSLSWNSEEDIWKGRKKSNGTKRKRRRVKRTTTTQCTGAHAWMG